MIFKSCYKNTKYTTLKRLAYPWLCLGLALCAASPIHAQTTPAGLTITPPLQHIELTPDQQTFQSTVIISNNQDQPVDLTISTIDFGDLEQGGGLAFLGDTPDSIWDKHRLTPWLSTNPQTTTIAARSQQAIDVTIYNHQDLAPGGHYAAVIATVDTPVADISVKPSLTSLLFVNKAGGAVYDVEVKDISPQAAWWGSVSSAQFELHNNGNTHVTPRGQVQVKDPSGAVIAQGIINAQSGLLMPQQNHTYQSNLSSTNLPWLPGNYTMVLSYRYDGTDQTITEEQTIFSLGILLTVTLCLLLSSLVALIIRKVLTRKTGQDFT